MAEDHTGLEVAIVGMACRYPGADSPAEFWSNLEAGAESISFPSEEELVVAGVDVDEMFRPDYVKAGGWLKAPFAFDNEFFAVSDLEADIMDPQQRVFLTCCWEAFEDAGYAPEDLDAPAGVFAGAMENTYLREHVAPNKERVAWLGAPLVSLSNHGTFMPTRASYKLNLTGPSLAVGTACSTGLVAVHLACKALLAGECDFALAGASAINFPHRVGYRFFGEAGGAVSKDGHCRPFDAKAQGLVPSSGVGVLLLRRLEDAVRDRDHVYAVIKGAAINNDGRRKVGFMAPSVTGQTEVIRLALDMAEVEPDSISFVETHGTATPLGDPIELQGLSDAFQLRTPGACAIGSVKANIGHAQEAAGVAGLIKAALALKHRRLPPQINYVTPNPELHLEDSPFFVAEGGLDWRTDERVLRAGVSSFGIGGTNAHAILAQAPLQARIPSQRPTHVLTVSARTPSQLQSTLTQLADRFRNADVDIADAAYTLNVGRKAFGFRTALTVRTREDAAGGLHAAASALSRANAATPAATRAEVALVLQGDLCGDAAAIRKLQETHACFDEAMRACLECAPVSARKRAHAWLSGGIVEPDLLMAFAVRYALARTCIELRLRPAGVCGFGAAGRLAAATIAQSITLAQAVGCAAEEHFQFSKNDVSNPTLPLYLGSDAVPAHDVRRIAELLAASSSAKTVNDKQIDRLREDASVLVIIDAAPASLEGAVSLHPDAEAIARAAGVLWERGCPIDWHAYHRADPRSRVPLPTYPFDTTSRVLKAPPRVRTAAQAATAPTPKRRESVAQLGAGEEQVQDILRERIAELWRELLGSEEIGHDVSFMTLGGDSLQLFRLATGLREMFEIDLEVRALFERPTISAQAALVEELLSEKIDAEERAGAPASGIG